MSAEVKVPPPADVSDAPAEHLPGSPLQEAIRPMVDSQKFELGLCVVIFLNMILLIVEADYDGRGDEPPLVVSAMNVLLLTLYAVEVMMRIFVLRLEYFHDRWHIMDFSIVGVDVFMTLLGAALGDKLPSMSMMRLLRLLRLAKSHIIIQIIPELNMQVQCLIGSIKSLFWGGVIVTFTLIIYSIVAVQLIHPLNQKIAAKGKYDGCERCPHAFESVFSSSLTFVQQIIAGDSWGSVTVPIIDEYPATGIFFMLVFVSLAMALMNVVLAAVVDSANQARADNVEFMNEQKAQERKKAEAHMMVICEEMDSDGGGTLTKQELLSGYDHNKEFRAAMDEMDIELKEMEVVWAILDEDNSGTIDYTEFTEQLFKMKSKDSHTMLVFIKHYIQEIRTRVNQEMTLIKTDICEQMVLMNRAQVDLLNKLESMEKEEKEIGKDMKKELAEQQKLEHIEEEVLRGEAPLQSPAGVSGTAASPDEEVLVSSLALAAVPRIASSLPGAPPINAEIDQPLAMKQLLTFLSDLERQLGSFTSSFPKPLANEHSGSGFQQTVNLESQVRLSRPDRSRQPANAPGRQEVAGRWPGGGCCRGSTQPIVIPVDTHQPDGSTN